MEPHSLVLTSASTLETSHHYSLHNRRLAQQLPVLPPQARRPLQNLAHHLARSLRQLGQRLRAGRDARRASVARVEQPIPAEGPDSGEDGSCTYGAPLQPQPQPQPQRLSGWGARRRARAAAARAAAAAVATGAAEAPTAAGAAVASRTAHGSQPHSPHHHASSSQLHHFHVSRHVVHVPQPQPQEAASAGTEHAVRNSDGRYGTLVGPAPALTSSANAANAHPQQEQHQRQLLEESRHHVEVTTLPHSAAVGSLLSTDTSARISSGGSSTASPAAANALAPAPCENKSMELVVVRPPRRGLLRQLGRALRFVGANLGPKGPGENDKTRVERLLNVATCGMFFQAGGRIVRLCRAAAARRFGWAFCAVGVVATVYHASWGERFRPAARKVDYWSIAVSSMLLRGVLVGRLPALAAAAMVAAIPFKPSLVSTTNFMAVEIRYMLLALSCPSLLPAWAAHTGMSLTATACFSLEDTPLLSWFPYTHATFHALSAAAFLTLPGAMNTMLQSSPLSGAVQAVA
ncbi:hypothetical protein HYH02_000918 [Chlamydomonas schloesseri]|uniref:Uncharacterized protein n=1 Tax=Chlamydomonas schloesseri TaxID=2026947 RepID=A0A835WVJ4_9CHLO|nr:hypothetical protein HYH02_000918 [Chlamydomonas schloesseri]|eukprot:KAG2455098.1 hypothetical protein HYH02_000918 [Chlamydomonas schloesseri]